MFWNAFFALIHFFLAKLKGGKYPAGTRVSVSEAHEILKVLMVSIVLNSFEDVSTEIEGNRNAGPLTKSANFLASTFRQTSTLT